jgi:hypothetical protein
LYLSAKVIILGNIECNHISKLPQAKIPLSGAEILPIVQNNETRKVAAQNIANIKKKKWFNSTVLIDGNPSIGTIMLDKIKVYLGFKNGADTSNLYLCLATKVKQPIWIRTIRVSRKRAYRITGYKTLRKTQIPIDNGSGCYIYPDAQELNFYMANTQLYSYFRRTGKFSWIRIVPQKINKVSITETGGGANQVKRRNEYELAVQLRKTINTSGDSVLIGILKKFKLLVRVVQSGMDITLRFFDITD